MSADKRSVATDATATIGTILTGEAGRDAIHIAVEPVTAGHALRPGDPIHIVEGLARWCQRDEAVGIVDPFLAETVEMGQRFWLVLLPRTITSLRHVWSHPAFAEDGEAALEAGDRRAASERWLRDFVSRSDCPGYETVLAHALGEGGSAQFDPAEYLHFDGMDAHGEIPPEFWDHVEVVTGRKVPYRPTYFSCSC